MSTTFTTSLLFTYLLRQTFPLRVFSFTLIPYSVFFEELQFAHSLWLLFCLWQNTSLFCLCSQKPFYYVHSVISFSASNSFSCHLAWCILELFVNVTDGNLTFYLLIVCGFLLLLLCCVQMENLNVLLLGITGSKGRLASVFHLYKTHKYFLLTCVFWEVFLPSRRHIPIQVVHMGFDPELEPTGE